MALKTCPDCNKEVSTLAEACPNCGHPFKIQPKTTETVVTPTAERDNAVPRWIVFPVIILVGVLVVVILLLFKNNGNADDQNLNVDISAQRQNDNQTVPNPGDSNEPIQTPADTSPPTDITIPQTDNQQTIPADSQTQVIDDKPDKGKVEIEAKVADKNGKITPVEKEKFYLLDKDLESILREAKLQSIENQNLINSFGLSVLNPGKYKEFNQKALDAINDHIKYDTLTGAGGKASLTDVEPKSYYLFAIHKVGNGFAIWNSTVNIKPGQNTLNIRPPRMTEVN